MDENYIIGKAVETVNAEVIGQSVTSIFTAYGNGTCKVDTWHTFEDKSVHVMNCIAFSESDSALAILAKIVRLGGMPNRCWINSFYESDEIGHKLPYEGQHIHGHIDYSTSRQAVDHVAWIGSSGVTGHDIFDERPDELTRYDFFFEDDEESFWPVSPACAAEMAADAFENLLANN